MTGDERTVPDEGDEPKDTSFLGRLSAGIESSLLLALQRWRDAPEDDFADRWGAIAAAWLDGLRLLAPPALDARQKVMPFVQDHRMSATLFDVLRGGTLGGPKVDMLFQLWLRTEEKSAAWGVPLIFCPVSADAGLHGIRAMDAVSFAGFRRAPQPADGRWLNEFALDLASGWIGDFALSGWERSAMLDLFLRDFDVRRVLRLAVDVAGGRERRAEAMPLRRR